MSVVKDKTQTIAESWPRPKLVKCNCGGDAIQREDGSNRYTCVKCWTSIIHYTGFDDPTWS